MSSGHAHLDHQRYDIACREPALDVVENFRREYTGQGSDYELISTVKMELDISLDHLIVYVWRYVLYVF